MISIRMNDKIYFASALKNRGCFLHQNVDYHDNDERNIWHDPKRGYIIGVASQSSRLIDILRYSNVFDVDLTREGMRELIKRIRSEFNDTNCLIPDKRLGVMIFISDGKNGFEISSYGCVTELDDFNVCDEFVELMLATKVCIKDGDIEKTVRDIFKLAGDMMKNDYFPIGLIDAEASDIKIIYNNENIK